MDQLPPPPPYSPRDPHGPFSSSPSSSDDTIQQFPLRATLRGGYLNIIDDTESAPQSPTATFIVERPLNVQVPSEILHLEHPITPATIRDDLLFPSLDLELQQHDVSRQDWASFINFIIAELQGGVNHAKEKDGGQMSSEQFQICQEKIESVIAEWNEGFFGPRAVVFTALYQYAPVERGPSPAPSYRTSQTVISPTGGQPSSTENIRVHASMTPIHMHSGLGPVSPRMPPFLPPGLPHPRSMHVIPPQFSHPLRHSHLGCSAGPDHFHDYGYLYGGRGQSHHCRGNNGHGGGRDDRGRRGHGRGSNRESHNRSASSSSSSSSSSEEIHSRHGKRKAHRHSLSCEFSSDVESFKEHRGRHGRRGGFYHRSESSSSSSSSSTDSSASSISSDDLEGVEDEDIKQSLENFRRNPRRIFQLHSAVRQFHSELRSHRIGNNRGSFEKRPNSIERTKEVRAKRKAQKKLIKVTVKEVKKDARKERHALKRQHKAEKRKARAQGPLHKVAHRLRDIGFGGIIRPMQGTFPGDLPDLVDARRWEPAGSRGFADFRSPAADSSSLNEMASDVGRSDGHPGHTSGYVEIKREPADIASDPGHLDHADASPTDTRESTVVPDVDMKQQKASTEEFVKQAKRDVITARKRQQSQMARRTYREKAKKERERETEEAGREARRKQHEAEAFAREAENNAERRETDERRTPLESEIAAENEKGKAVDLFEKQQQWQAEQQRHRQEQQAEQRRRQLEIQRRQQEHQAEFERRRQAWQHANRYGRHGRHQEDVTEAQSGPQLQSTQQEGINEAVPSDQSRSPWIPPVSHLPHPSFRGAQPCGMTPGSHLSHPSFHGGRGYGSIFENLGRGIEQWGERFGRDMEAWGERFGKDMESKFS